MSLPIQKIRLSEVAEAGMDFDSFPADDVEAGMPPLRVIGECFAFRFADLEAQALQEDVSWHEWLLRRVVVGLRKEAIKKPVFVCYTVHPDIIRVFFCCKREDEDDEMFYHGVHGAMAQRPAYMESGEDGFPPQFARPLAFWEPPGTAVALWPTGLRGETDGLRVVDTGNAMSYFSYPESDHAARMPVKKVGPEYICVPQQEHAEFECNGRVYRYLNRWALVEMDLKSDGWFG